MSQWLQHAVNAISPERRELYFRVIDTYPNVHPITYRLHYLENHFPPMKLDSALQWLIANNLVGQRFLDWYKQICHSSDLEMHRMLWMAVNNSPLAPIIAGKNFRT